MRNITDVGLQKLVSTLKNIWRCGIKIGRWKINSDVLNHTLLRWCWRRRRHFPSWPVQNRFLLNWKQRWIRRAWMILIREMNILFLWSWTSYMLYCVVFTYLSYYDVKIYLCARYEIGKQLFNTNVNLRNTGIINCKQINLPKWVMELCKRF